MTNVDAREAASALNDIEQVVHRVRQSRIYDIASQILIMWGLLVFAGNLVNFAWPNYGGQIWIAVNGAGVLGTAAIMASSYARTGARGFEVRILAAYLLFFAFGYLCSAVLGHYTPRQLATFWPIYFMLFYSIAGLWFGSAFVAIGIGISALTLIGYFFVPGEAFLLWMAVVNGGGMAFGGLWMRRS